MSGECLAEDVIARLALGEIDDEGRAVAIAHVESCAICRKLVAAAARAGDRDGPLLAGDKIGRYVVERVLGAGAMGVVYAARDPELARSLALKLLRTDRDGAGSASDDVLRERLLREARALARLAHPNVVTLFDVGTFGDRVYLAMELVRGCTLTEWLAAAPRTASEVLAQYRQAGEGLRAAHANGIVHRDFKPDNVLVGDDGRVRVTDFGLARGAEDEPRAAGATGDVAANAANDARASLTQTGAALGTPAYMAPEQRAGGGSSVRSDVYAFSVALHEGLHGVRPDAPGAKRRAVPGWLERVVARGLRAEPSARWPSMDAMLAAIDRGLARRRRGAIGAMLVAVLALAGGSAAWAKRSNAVEPCATSAAAWSAIWNDDSRAKIRDAFARAESAHGAELFAVVSAALDAYGATFVAQTRDACEATRVRGDQSEAMLDTRMECLDLRKREASSLVTLLESADAELVANAVTAVQRLPDAAFCGNRASLSARAAARSVPRTDATDRFDAAHADLATLVAADRLDAARTGLEALDSLAKSIGDPWRDARVAKVRGDLAARTSQLELANESLQSAAAGALATGDDELLADSWILLVMTEMRVGARVESEHAAAHAHAAIARMGGDDVREAVRLRNYAGARFHAGDDEGASKMVTEAERLLLRANHADDTRLADVWTVAAAIADSRGDFATSASYDERCAALYARVRGADHWSVDLARGNLAGEWIALGRVDDAIAVMEAILLRHDGWLYLNTDIATGLRAKGDYARALERDTRARVGIEAKHADALNLAMALLGQGDDLVHLGRAREAIEPLERVVAMQAPVTPTDLARAETRLARAIEATHGDLGRASRLLGAGCARFVAAAKDGSAGARAELADLAKWESTLRASSPMKRACAID